jgi:hypothetical protein
LGFRKAARASVSATFGRLRLRKADRSGADHA